MFDSLTVGFTIPTVYLMFYKRISRISQIRLVPGVREALSKPGLLTNKKSANGTRRGREAAEKGAEAVYLAT